MTNVMHTIWKSRALEHHPVNETLSLFYSRIPTWRSGIEKISSYSIDDLLQQASNHPQVEWVVVHAEGNLYHSQNKILEVVEEFINTLSSDTLVAGHLMNRPGYYCGIHEQFMIINAKAYDRLGRPEFGSVRSDEVVLQNYLAGPSVHDDYTPMYLEARGDRQKFKIGTAGWGLVNAALANGLRVVNIPNSIRNEKIYIYPHDETAKLLKNIDALFDIMPMKNTSQNKALTFLLLKKLGIGDYAWPNGMAQYHERKFTVFAYNTETLVPNPAWIQAHPGQLDRLIVTCAGFLDIANLKHFGFSDQTELVYYDVNPDSLYFKEYMLENFDGDLERLPQFIQNFKDKHPDITLADNSEHQGYMELRAEFTSCQEFSDLWNRMRKLKRRIERCNLLEEYSILLGDFSNQRKRTLICISDIFTGTNELLYGTHNLKRVYLELINKLADREDTMIQGSDFCFTPVMDYARNLVKHYR